MSTARLPRSGARKPVAGRPEAPAARVPARTAAPVALALGGFAVLVYAAFALGAVASQSEVRVQVAVAVLATIAAAGWLWRGTLRLAAPGLAWAGLGLLAAFAAWIGVTVLWSVSPDQTWIDLDRAITYVVVLCLALAVGGSHPRALELVGRGFLLLAMAVTVYALGQKLVPGLDVPGVLDLNQTGPLPRLQLPFGYWNALALFIAMGVPIALALGADRSRPDRQRVVALVALCLMLLTIGFTYSRGGVLALAVALAAGIVLSRARLRSLMWLRLACVATLPPLLLGLMSHDLISANVGLGRRESAGAELAAVLLVCLLALGLAAGRLMRLERAARIGPEGARRIGRILATLVGIGLACGVLALAVSSRGLPGTFSHAWSSFTATRATSVYSPDRLLSADSENRWVWWKEALGAFSDRPVAGWGGGSFGVVHLLYRRGSARSIDDRDPPRPAGPGAHRPSRRNQAGPHRYPGLGGSGLRRLLHARCSRGSQRCAPDRPARSARHDRELPGATGHARAHPAQ